MPRVRCSISGSRRYPANPIPGVGAIIIEGDRILMVERGREPLTGYWSLPGGVLEVGETLVQAVKREVQEETGLFIEPTEIVEIFERIIHDEAGAVEYHYVLVDYRCTVLGGTLLAADDASGVAWIERSRLGDYRITEGTVPVIEKAFARR
jgi:8-oxo-dGTP diphosphatase